MRVYSKKLMGTRYALLSSLHSFLEGTLMWSQSRLEINVHRAPYFSWTYVSEATVSKIEPIRLCPDWNVSDEMITTDEVIKELFEIADKKVPEQVVDRDEIRGELDELNEG